MQIATIANHGYVDYAVNWFRWLERCGLAERAVVHALDADADRELEAHGVATAMVTSDALPPCPSAFTEYLATGWRELMLRKMVAIHSVLTSGETILFADADVVFLKDPRARIEALAADNDLAIQVDNPPEDKGHLCAGFFRARPSLAMLELFRSDAGDEHDHPCDQQLLNARIRAMGLKPCLLPAMDFPNGALWYSGSIARHHPYIVHFNWCIGHKRELMQRHGMWLL